MWRLTIILAVITVYANGQNIRPRSGDELVSTVLNNCIDMSCVKQNVLEYLDNVLNMQSDLRNAKNIDAAIFKRAARLLKTHEFRFTLPEQFFDKTEIIYNPRSGLDIAPFVNDEEGRVIGLKKKLLFPVLLLLKLKMKLLMPLFVALIGLKATKALILSKLAIFIVLGFIIYQLLGKSGMPLAMSMAPAPIEPSAPMYGAPSTAIPSSYEPGWEPNQGGPYQRIWTTSNNDPQTLSYSAYYPGIATSSSSTSRP